jgi:hypothetical protein
MATPAQIAANRHNARKSTGPRTAAGKAVSSRNALRHGLAARAAIVLGEDPADLQRFRAELRAALAPKDGREELLAETAAEAAWRLRRVWRAEAALVNRSGRLDVAPSRLRDLLILRRYEAAANRRFHRAVAMLEHGRSLATNRDPRSLSCPPTHILSAHESLPAQSSCPCLSRASTFSCAAGQHVDGRDEHGHDEGGVNRERASRRSFRAVRRRGRTWNRSDRVRRVATSARRAARNPRFRGRNPIWEPHGHAQPLAMSVTWQNRGARLGFVEKRLIAGKSALKGHQPRENLLECALTGPPTWQGPRRAAALPSAHHAPMTPD